MVKKAPIVRTIVYEGSIGAQIAAMRERKGWSQAELGRRMSKPASVIHRLEAEEYEAYNVRTLREVAEAFHATLRINFCVPD